MLKQTFASMQTYVFGLSLFIRQVLQKIIKKMMVVDIFVRNGLSMKRNGPDWQSRK